MIFAAAAWTYIYIYIYDFQILACEIAITAYGPGQCKEPTTQPSTSQLAFWRLGMVRNSIYIRERMSAGPGDFPRPRYYLPHNSQGKKLNENSNHDRYCEEVRFHGSAKAKERAETYNTHGLRPRFAAACNGCVIAVNLTGKCTRLPIPACM